MPKLKQLFKKFSYREILAECTKQGWELPSSVDIRGQNGLDHNIVWVTDIPEKEEDRDSHGLIYIIDQDKLAVCNKHFMQNILVIKIERCPTCGN